MSGADRVDPATEEIRATAGIPHADAVGFMNRVYAAAGIEPDEIPAATHWPTLHPDRAEKEWESLSRWVDQLRDRFEFLDHHVIPHCWWRHNQHVEALAALRDHERVSFNELAPATAPADWLRTLRDIASVMQLWTAQLSCGATHQPPIQVAVPLDQDAWRQHIATDLERRRSSSAEDR